MSECFKQLNAGSKAVYGFKQKAQLKENFTEFNSVYHKDIDDRGDLTTLETLTSTSAIIVSSIHRCSNICLQGADQRKKTMPLVKALPQVRALLKVPQFWNKYDSEQIAEITRENARQIAENDTTIGEKLIYNCDKEIKHMLFIYEALQESIWNLDLRYLNAYKATVVLKNRKKYQKRHGRKAGSALKRIEQKRLEIVEQKIGILQTMADAPFEIADYLRANPTVTDVDLL